MYSFHRASEIASSKQPIRDCKQLLTFECSLLQWHFGSWYTKPRQKSKKSLEMMKTIKTQCNFLPPVRYLSPPVYRFRMREGMVCNTHFSTITLPAEKTWQGSRTNSSWLVPERERERKVGVGEGGGGGGRVGGGGEEHTSVYRDSCEEKEIWKGRHTHWKIERQEKWRSSDLSNICSCYCPRVWNEGDVVALCQFVICWKQIAGTLYNCCWFLLFSFLNKMFIL